MLKRFMSFFVAVLVLLSVFSFTPTDSKAATVNYKVGFSQGNELVDTGKTTDAEVTQILDGIAATGAGYVRLDFVWGHIESTKGNFNWTRLDSVISKCNARGIKVIALPTSCPGWAGPGWEKPPTNGSDFRNFCYQAAKRYIPQGVVVFELWNEANIKGMTVAEYTSRILIPGSNGVRQAANELAKQATVLTTGFASAADGTAQSPISWLNGIYANGGKNYFDAVANHPYNWDKTPSDPNDIENPLDPNDKFMRQQLLYDIMVSNGDGAKKIWVTEFGKPTSPNGLNVYCAVREQDQGNYIVQTYNQWKNTSYAGGPFIIYQYKDAKPDAGWAANERERFFGIKYIDGTPKPGYQAVVNMINSITYYRIQDRWQGRYLYDGGAALKYGTGTGDSYLWEIVDIDSTWKRFKNKATNEYINIQDNLAYVEVDMLNPGDTWSSQWKLTASDSGWSYINCRWDSYPNYWHVQSQNGNVQHAASVSGWYSAQWKLIPQ